MSDELDDLESELEETAPVKKALSGSPGKRLTPAEWEEVKTLWELGTVTLAELQDRFGVRSDTLQKRLKGEGVVKGARAAEMGAIAEDVAKDTAVINAKRVADTKESHYSYAEALAKLVMQEVVETKKNKKPIALADANLAALNKAAKTLEVIRKERYTILGLDKEDGDPDDIPELMISEMTEEQIRDIQAAMRSQEEIDLNFDDDDVVVEEED